MKVHAGQLDSGCSINPNYPKTDEPFSLPWCRQYLSAVWFCATKTFVRSTPTLANSDKYFRWFSCSRHFISCCNCYHKLRIADEEQQNTISAFWAATFASASMAARRVRWVCACSSIVLFSWKSASKKRSLPLLLKALLIFSQSVVCQFLLLPSTSVSPYFKVKPVVLHQQAAEIESSSRLHCCACSVILLTHDSLDTPLLRS